MIETSNLAKQYNCEHISDLKDTYLRQFRNLGNAVEKLQRV